MATVIAPPPVFSGDLALFHTTDPLLGNSPVLVFHGPAATIGATSSRIQVHVLTPAGLGSYPRLSVSPNSPFYSAVSNLPREEQGDEVIRGLAFGLKKYFVELGVGVKKTWTAQVKAPSPGALFGDDHIAILATRMTRIANMDDVVGDFSDAFCEQRLSWLDVDVVLPPGSIKERPDSAGSEELNDLELLQRQYGRYAQMIASFGEVAFLPTSRMRRAPSKANAVGRSTSFLRSHKENVRKELNELVTTEESYVRRLQELQNLSGNLGADLRARHQQTLSDIFPATIGQILEANLALLEELRTVVRSSDAAAQEDIENSSDDLPTTDRSIAESRGDLQGLEGVAQCLCDWIPKLAGPYKEYMSSHAQASYTLRTLLRNNDSLAFELQEIGEQKLTSLLIEPIQRLPRYNLYIDSVVKQLPVKHSALKLLLKARDLITDICAEQQGTEPTTIVERLRSRTLGWPIDISVSGRLVTAVDYVELMPPYGLQKCEGSHGILFLFTDGIIVVEKATTTSARTLLTEIESGPLPTRSVESLAETIGDLHFVRRLQLDALQCTESHDGCALQMMTFFQLSAGALGAQEPILDSCQILRLEGSYDGRAGRFAEEVAKARVESRFSEAERECWTWESRATDPATDSVGLLSAIFEDSNGKFVSARGSSASVRIVVDSERHTTPVQAAQNGLHTVINLTSHRDGDWRISSDSVNGNFGREHVDTADLVPALRRKVALIMSARLSMEQPAVTACLLLRNADILQSLELFAAPTADSQGRPQLLPREKFHRPKSPKKLLSSFLSSVGPGAEPPNIHKKELPGLPPPTYTAIPRLSSSHSQKPSSRDGVSSSQDQTMPFSPISDVAAMQLKKLEDTLSAYILALQARKGNIVGKNLKLRLVADQGLVSELYDGLLEDPNMMVLAAQAPLDVLFAAFEKFLNIAWRERIGQVMPMAVLHDIQCKAETAYPADFDEYFRCSLGRLAPQNQRAFKGILKLLADLLDGMGNDGDRGILTACFAEVLVPEGNPHDYIALIDRFVDDTDTYFGEPLEASFSYKESGSVSSHKRARSVNSASLTSNTSSLRRKFGFGTLSRENSKSEQESKVSSVWRTLSKSTRADYSPANSISRASVGRTRSIDTDPANLGYRPPSQDSTKVSLSSFGELPNITRTPSSQNLGLSTIGEHPSFIPTGPPRKKRRSSLSDLQGPGSSPAREPWSPESPRRSVITQKILEEKQLPDSPTIPSTPSSRDNTGRFGSPPQKSPRSRLPSSFRREPSPGPVKAFARQPPSLPRPELPRARTSGALDASERLRPKTSGDRPDEVIISGRPTSNIPSLMPRTTSPAKATPSTPNRTGLSERPGAGNIVKRPSPQAEKFTRTRSTTIDTPATHAQPRKLRMQSPQKLRERLQNEQGSIAAAQSSLQEELSKIGDELTSTPNMRSSIRGGRTTGGRGSISQAGNMDLAQRVLKMEAQLPKQMEDLTNRISVLQSDLATSLSVSEMKCKKLDELYREANGENEALYTRFNDELGRILKAVRGGEGVEELKKTLKESHEETAKLKRETSRLKRENVGLRAQLRE